MNGPVRFAALREYLRGSLWVLPTASVGVALVVATVLATLPTDTRGPWDFLLFGGQPEGARAVLEVIAGSVITVTSVTFSLTVVALQMAASQYSPRLLRNFLRDRGNQIVLAIFLATFAFSLTVLRTVRSGAADAEQFVPRLAVTVAVLLAFASLGALVYFIHHLTQSIRVEEILRQIVHETLAVTERNFAPACAAPSDDGDVVPEVPDGARPLAAWRSGYLQALRRDTVLELAREHGVTLRLSVPVGAHVLKGSTLAVVWAPDGAGARQVSGQTAETLGESIGEALQIVSERTMQQDVAYGIRQLADIAVRAVSPSLNDPTTAVETTRQLAVVVHDLAGRRLGAQVLRDGDGVVVVPGRGFAEYLGLACNQIAHYGSGDPAVVHAVIDLLDTLTGVVRTTERRRAVQECLDRTVAEAQQGLLLASDRVAVRRRADAVRRALTAPAVEQPDPGGNGSLPSGRDRGGAR